MTRKNAMTTDDADQELEMLHGSNVPVGEDDEFDPGAILGLTNVVPILPEIPGFHCAWAAIASDLIPDPSRWVKMYQLGYRPISIEEFTKYDRYGGYAADQYRVKETNNEFTGAVRYMDVVAVKIPLHKHVAITKYLEAQVLRTEADLKSRPVSNLSDGRYTQIQVEQGQTRIGTHTNIQDAYDKL